MSLPTQTMKRLPKIKANLLTGLNYHQIGINCGVTEKTIDRDMKAFVESGLFETWLKEEFLRLHGKVVAKDEIEAYRNVCKLVGKMITRRMELQEDIHIQEEIHMDISVFSDDDKSILDQAARILDRKSKRKSDSIH